MTRLPVSYARHVTAFSLGTLGTQTEITSEMGVKLALLVEAQSIEVDAGSFVRCYPLSQIKTYDLQVTDGSIQPRPVSAGEASPPPAGTPTPAKSRRKS